jgi:hypothetical protein
MFFPCLATSPSVPYPFPGQDVFPKKAGRLEKFKRALLSLFGLRASVVGFALTGM